MKYFKYAFGVDGDLLAIPNPTQISGVVSYQVGFPIDYQLVDTDPSSLNIQRNQFNQLMNDTTGAIQQLQQNGFPIHITAAMNDGVAYGYSKNSYVRATDNNVYYSLTNANVDVPPSVNWQLAGSEVLQYFNFAVDTGVANHYIIAPDPAVTAYADGDFVLLRPQHANTGACDIKVNLLGVIPIKTMTNLNPSAGMIIPTGAYILMYFGGVFVLCNPTLGTAAYAALGSALGELQELIFTTGATTGSFQIGPYLVQFGKGVSDWRWHQTFNTFPIEFSAKPLYVNFVPELSASPPNFTTGVQTTPNVSGVSMTGFYAQNQNNGTNEPCFYLAIGLA